MANLLCLEPIGGIAGDMFLALAVDLGVPVAQLEAGLRTLALEGWRIEAQRAVRHAIAGTHVEVVGEGLEDDHHDHDHDHVNVNVNDNVPDHVHVHGHVHDQPHHSHGGTQEDAAHAHRSWREIRTLIGSASLPPRVKERALELFERVARAEATVHGTTPEDVRFHEVGAIDSIVDSVGAALALELLDVDEVLCAPPPLGSGLSRSAHGPMPIPPPATVEILRGRAVRFEGRGELTTPTGAAIVAALTREGPFPEMVLDRIGYGVGRADFPDRPNVLRGLLGRRTHGADEGTFLLEANLDDATPQLLAWTIDLSLNAGALDAWVAPVTMKKGRPGHVLGVLVPGPRRAALTELLLRETTTLGVRASRVERTALERDCTQVETPYGQVSVKTGRLGGATLNAAPEYEDCARVAREAGVPLKEVIASALAAFRRPR